jgi:hypothetical protein
MMVLDGLPLHHAAPIAGLDCETMSYVFPSPALAGFSALSLAGGISRRRRGVVAGPASLAAHLLP